ncbi:transmembrane protein 230a isoform X3 [Electrophorus electricus]|uniref:transmembrane protein 230a isoform X3 n=1 Tax=Electrophorus electricus TaxID=8005 RepID=UPI000F0A4C5B|nr:transmembrane protein 230a isoform X3 [Electrophorus electricus]
MFSNLTRLLPLSITIMVPSRGGTAGGGINSVKYSRLAESDEGYIDLQFKRTPPKVPYKAIALAVFLFLYPDRTIPVLIIGVLIFLPGFYHLRIAYYASKGYRGYSYDDIPDFDD